MILNQNTRIHIEKPQNLDLLKKISKENGSLAQKLGCDYINLGFSGSAKMEESMAQYITSRKDWDFATVEMGINALDMSSQLFEERIDRFTEILAQDKRPVYATNIYGYTTPDQTVAKNFRRIVEKYAKARLHFADGLDFLSNDTYISQDMVHPSLEGMEKIVEHWYSILGESFKNSI